MPFETNQDLEATIEAIAEESKVMALGLSTDDIRRMVKVQLGFEPSRSTVQRVLRRLGIDNGGKQKKTWVYQHNKGDE
jgi:hypothetical protein